VKTITFYSYKGGTGRSLTVANAALYLSRLDFSVVVVDFDLEAPGLHYKLALEPDKARLPVSNGVVDYIYEYITRGEIPNNISDFTIHLRKGTGSDLSLIPAGNAPEAEYWSKLSHINWHQLFYSKESQGVELFFDFKNKIEGDLKPDFLLIDARTGITETGGVATSLLADRVICLVSPSRENLEGARAVLQSVNRTRRGYQIVPAEITIALGRVPEIENDSEMIAQVVSFLNVESPTLEDTLTVSEKDAVILHSEHSLEIREALRVGSGVRTEDSILLRDYLRLFASIVPPDLIGSKLKIMMAKARDKIWEDPQEAVKEVEELAESFGHPDTYRELLRFYSVRNVRGAPVLRRAQRLWELSRDSQDQILWRAVAANFPIEGRLARPRDPEFFQPSLDFIEAVWRDAGKRDVDVGVKIADYYMQKDNIPGSIAILMELIENGNAKPDVVSKCLARLLRSGKVQEARSLIERFRDQYGLEYGFAAQWAQYALVTRDMEYIKILLDAPYVDVLRRSPSLILLRLLVAGDRRAEARELGEGMVAQGRNPELLYSVRENPGEVVEAFVSVELGSEILSILGDYMPDHELERLRRRYHIRKSE
jgi:MinD-like ATPase involved in chromosome partitioning or flagellar assembly